MNAPGGLSVEADSGSATSWGRQPESSWLVRICRDDRCVIVAWGLSRTAAERLAGRITEVVYGGSHDRRGRQ